MALMDLMSSGLPLNRKERFYTGTVTPSWGRLMERWQAQAVKDPNDRQALRLIRREGHS